MTSVPEEQILAAKLFVYVSFFAFNFSTFFSSFFLLGTRRASALSDLINSNVLGTFFEPDSEGQRKIPACQSMSDETLICNPICT